MSMDAASLPIRARLQALNARLLSEAGAHPALSTQPDERILAAGCALLDAAAMVLEGGENDALARVTLDVWAGGRPAGLPLEAMLRLLDALDVCLAGELAQPDELRRLWSAAARARAVLADRNEARRAEEVRMLQQVLDELPLTVFWKDRDLNILGCNLAYARDAGRSTVGEMIGKSDYDDMPWQDEADLYRADDALIMQSGQARVNFEEPHTGADGEMTWVRTSKSPLRDERGEVFGVLGSYEYITERKREEARIKEQALRRGSQVQAITHIAQEIAAAPNLHELTQHVVDLVQERFGYYHVQLMRLAPGGQALDLIAGVGETGRKMAAAGHRLGLDEGLIGKAAATARALLRPMLANDPDWKPNPWLPETRGELAAPIILRGQALGVLDVQHSTAGALGEDDRMLLEGVCGQIAAAMEATRLRQEMADRLRELDALTRFASRTGWDALRRVRPGGQVFLFDGLAVRERRVESVPGGSGEPDVDWMAGGIETALMARGETIGALGVIAEPGRPLSAADKRFIEQAANQVAQALEGARLFQQTNQALAESQALFHGSARILRAASLQQILEALIDQPPLAQIDQGSLLFFDRPWNETQAPQEMAVAAAFDRQAGAVQIGRRLPFEQFAAWAVVMQRGQAHVIPDIQVDEIAHQSMPQFLEAGQTHGVVVWPLNVGNDVIGFFSGQSTHHLDISAEAMRLVSSLVDQAAIVLQGLRLRAEMSARVDELSGLQRLMSRTAWAEYERRALPQEHGFIYDLVDVVPAGASVQPTGGPSDNGSGVSAPTQFSEDGHVAPLTVQGERIGSLGVRLEQGRRLTAEEEEFLAAISEQTAQALERARLMEQTQKSAVELQAVAEVSTAAATLLNPAELLQRVADLTQERFGLYHVNIYLLDSDGRALNLAAGSGKTGRLMAEGDWRISLEQEGSPVARAARSRKPQIVGDVYRETGYLLNPLLAETRAQLSAPMLIGERLLGVFDVHSNRVNRFGEDDVRTHTTLAAQSAVALQNARLYAEQMETLERMRELDNMKSAFLANMSHELRTPLNSILGFTQVILEELDGPVTEIMSSDLDLIEKNGKHLLGLINEILDMSKIEAGRLSLSIEPVDVRKAMAAALETSASLAREHHLGLSLQADQSEDWVIDADEVRVRQIFYNLLGNAIKFTEHGGVQVSLHKVNLKSIDRLDGVQIRIQDTGLGIPRHKLEEIFEAFTQVDTSTTRKEGGAGLGLPISRRLAAMHGGRLWAESGGLGCGSTFVLELPIEQEYEMTVVQ